MSVHLIPHDELTLNLLAEVLAKMYRHSLKSNSASSDALESEPGALHADPEQRNQNRMTLEPDLIPAETL